MSSPRERKKARRRAEKTMDEAFEALLEGRLPLAERLARRAIDGSERNARLWLDLGRVLWRCDRLDEAEEALRRAIALAKDYGEAFAELAAFQAAAGKWRQAERLQRRAVELRPDDADAAAKLAHYAAMLPAADDGGGPDAAPATGLPAAPTAPPPPSPRAERFDWTAVAAELRTRGAARLERLVDESECAALRALWHADCFESERICDGDDGRFEERWFAAPLPPAVETLREDLYARLAPIADAWQQLLARRTRFPATHAEFAQRCADAWQHRPATALVRFPPGGHRAPHRDDPARVGFPFRLWLPLGPASGADPVALQLVDVRSGRPRRHAFPCAPGDGIVFAAPERLVDIAGVAAAQPVLHGTSECTAEQFVLAMPFHAAG